MSLLSQVRHRSSMFTNETAGGGETHRCRDETSQVKLRPPSLRDEDRILGVLGDPAPYVRAVGQDAQVACPGRLQTGLDEAPRDTMAAEPRIGLGMHKRDDTVAQVVLDETGDLAVRPDLVPLLLRIVGDLQLHTARIITRDSTDTSAGT